MYNYVNIAAYLISRFQVGNRLTAAPFGQDVGVLPEWREIISFEAYCSVNAVVIPFPFLESS